MRKKGDIMKKILCSVVALSVLISLTACGGNTSESNSTAVNFSDDIKIEDIDWSVSEGYLDGSNCLIFSYTNNSDYVITDVEMKFEQKEGTTPDDLAVLNPLKENTTNIDDEFLADAYITGYNRKVADVGETVSDSPCVLKNTYLAIQSMDQYNIMEPSSVDISYIKKDKMYAEHYDFKTQQYSSIGNKALDIYEWSDSEKATLLPKPDFDIVLISTDDEDKFSFTIYGASIDDFDSYTEECKEAGFNKSEYESDIRYRGVNDNNMEISISYNVVEESLYVSVELFEE